MPNAEARHQKREGRPRKAVAWLRAAGNDAGNAGVFPIVVASVRIRFARNGSASLGCASDQQSAEASGNRRNLSPGVTKPSLGHHCGAPSEDPTSPCCIRSSGQFESKLKPKPRDTARRWPLAGAGGLGRLVGRAGQAGCTSPRFLIFSSSVVRFRPSSCAARFLFQCVRSSACRIRSVSICSTVSLKESPSAGTLGA